MKEKKKKENFFAKRGFFVTLVVIVGIMLIAVVMNMIMPNNDEDNTFDADTWEKAVEQSSKNYNDGLTSVYQEEAKAVSSTATPMNENSQSDTAEANTQGDNRAIPGGTNAPAAQTVNTDEPENNNSEGSAQQTLSVLLAPVNGNIIKDFSADELQYSETMDDWRAHMGIDFAADEGTDVIAAADGTVEKLMTDGMLGTCIIIAHPDGLKTIYGNLQENSAVSEGTQVKAGEVIGKVGKTAALEILESPHLHFEVMYQDKNMNPHDYIKDLKQAAESNDENE